ncbi:MAG: 50S ribosomal protein L35 [Verrucomicrobia bacterium]|nr:50S ribosomal protein L35 [Verrucomicrobiota bacterium]
MEKTNKAVKKRFKISGTGKVLRNRAGRRHLAGSKKSKKCRAARRWQEADTTDTQRVIKNLPFNH